LELAEPDAGVGAQRGLAGRVDAPVGPPLDRGNRSGHEDRAAVVEHRQRLLNGEQGAAGIQAEDRIEVVLRDFAEPAGLAGPGTCEQHVDRALLPLDGLEEVVQVLEVGRVAAYSRDVAPNPVDGLVKYLLPASGDEDVRPLLDESLC